MLSGTRNRLQRMVAPGVVVAAFVLGLAAPAAGAPAICDDPTVELSPIEYAEICEGTGDGDGSDPPGEWICEHRGVRVDCTAHGVWFGSPSNPHFVYDDSDGGVYSRPNSTDDWGCWRQPYSGSESLPLPPGRQPGDGGWYQLYCLFDSGTEENPIVWPFLHWFDTGEAPSPEEIALSLLARIQLPRPEIATNPPTTGSVLVRMPTWLHTSDPETTWEENPDRDCSWGFCVWIEANADRIEWDMGNGDVVTCYEEQDIAWAPGMDFLNPGNACHYIYGRTSRNQSGGRYQVTATLYYTTEWGSDLTGDGEPFEDVSDYCGPAGNEPCQATAQILVEELQVLYGQ